MVACPLLKSVSTYDNHKGETHGQSRKQQSAERRQVVDDLHWRRATTTKSKPRTTTFIDRWITIRQPRSLIMARGQSQSRGGGSSRRGFAAMDPEKQRRIASMGGRASHGGRGRDYEDNGDRRSTRSSSQSSGGGYGGGSSSRRSRSRYEDEDDNYERGSRSQREYDEDDYDEEDDY